MSDGDEVQQSKRSKIENQKEDSMDCSSEYSAPTVSFGDGCDVSLFHSSDSEQNYVNNIFEATICKDYDISDKIVYLKNGSEAANQHRIVHAEAVKYLIAKSNIKWQPKNSRDDSYVYSSWTNWFCDMECHLFYIKVDVYYTRPPYVDGEMAKLHTNYEYLISIIQDEGGASTPEELVDGKNESQLQAYSLYGMLHSKYLLTNDGLEAMKSHYLDGRYGVCLNADCKFQRRIPCGKSKKFNDQHVVLFCPCCKKLYQPNIKYTCVDGAHFGGIEFLSTFFAKFPELINSKSTPPSTCKTKLPEKSPSPDVPRPKEKRPRRKASQVQCTSDLRIN